VHFEADPAKGLPYRLSLKFELFIVDTNNGVPICKANGGSVLSSVEITSSSIQKTTHFFTGEIQELLDSPALEQQFLGSLEAAYRCEEQGHKPSSTDVLQLILE
jgi:hypothetical protein